MIGNLLRSMGYAIPDDPDELGRILLRSSGRPFEDLVMDGLVLDDVASGLRSAQDALGFSPRLEVEILRPKVKPTREGVSREAFFELLPVLNDPQQRFGVNFFRPPLFKRGGGHHLAAGGYIYPEKLHPELRDIAPKGLILQIEDNEREGPFLIKPEDLWTSMTAIDPDTGKPRGLVRVRALGPLPETPPDPHRVQQLVVPGGAAAYHQDAFAPAGTETPASTTGSSGT